VDPRRVWRIAALLALLPGAAGGGEAVRLLVQSSPLAGLRYHAATEVWHELRVGERLELAREPGNAHDRNAVRVLWRGRMLGYVPRHENAALAWALDRGTPLRASISALSQRPGAARRLRFDVYVE
jgi:hypothetical protein